MLSQPIHQKLVNVHCAHIQIHKYKVLERQCALFLKTGGSTDPKITDQTRTDTKIADPKKTDPTIMDQTT